MNIEVGMYVRLCDGLKSDIGKVSKKPNNDVVVWVDKNGQYIKSEINFIKKASFNVIDLIECGDYVNGYLVVATDESIGSVGELANDEYIIYCTCDETFRNNDIKSIVTKEQFASMEYKLGNNNDN